MAKSKTSDVIKLAASAAVLLSCSGRRLSRKARRLITSDFLLDPSNAAHAKAISQLSAEVKKLAAEAFNGEKLSPDHLHRRWQHQKYDGWAGMIAVSTSNKVRPVVVDRARNPVAEGDTESPYSGCYVNASITLWAQNNKFGKRINANLRGVQFVDDGEAFGIAPVDADEEFDAGRCRGACRGGLRLWGVPCRVAGGLGCGLRPPGWTVALIVPPFSGEGHECCQDLCREVPAAGRGAGRSGQSKGGG